jgi:PEP-CTERM motif
MFKNLLLASAALLSASAIAQTLPFTDVQYTTSALAIAEGTTNGTSGASPFSPLPLVSVATAVGLDDFANAAAAGSTGLLTAVSSTDSLAGAASAEARSSFTGSFTASGALNLNIAFNTSNTLDLGSGSGVLFVLFTNTVGSTTTTLFNSVFTEPANLLLQYTLAAGSTSNLHLSLVSQAATTGAGQATENFSQVSFTGVVPEPATWLLLVAGIAAIGLRKTHALHSLHAQRAHNPTTA